VTSEQKNKMTKRRAQSIIELSILGAALLGILGLLIRYSSTISEAQNIQLRAMREALKLSATEAASTLSTPTSPPHAITPNNKTANRKSASVLWIEDKPTVEGGEKYGAASLTPAISFGTGTMTNLLQYPLRSGDPNSLPVMDIYVNGKHFSFTTANYDYEGWFVTNDGDPDPTTPPISWNFNCNPNQPNGSPIKQARCLTTVPNPNGGQPWTFGSAHPVFWTKVPRTDKNFCYSTGQPSDHHCTYVSSTELDERFRLDPLNGDPAPISTRAELQWQWFPVLLNNVAIDFFDENQDKKTYTSLDVDNDGHEEVILHLDQVGDFSCQPAPPAPQNNNLWQQCAISARYFWDDGKPSNDLLFSPNSDCCHNAWENGDYPEWRLGFKLVSVVTLDSENGDLNMGYNTIDKLQGKPKPGFVQGKAKIKTYATGDLDVTQKAQSSQSTKVSQQTKDTINVIEREIQLSNDTGRFVAGLNLPSCDSLPSGVSPQCSVNCSCFDPDNDVDVACSGNDCCDIGQNKYLTCFNRTNLVLYVRTLTGAKIGHKYKTITPATSFP